SGQTCVDGGRRQPGGPVSGVDGTGEAISGRGPGLGGAARSAIGNSPLAGGLAHAVHFLPRRPTWDAGFPRGGIFAQAIGVSQSSGNRPADAADSPRPTLLHSQRAARGSVMFWRWSILPAVALAILAMGAGPIPVENRIPAAITRTIQLPKNHPMTMPTDVAVDAL